MAITFRQQKEIELNTVIEAEKKKSAERVNAIEEPFKLKWTEEKKN